MGKELTIEKAQDDIKITKEDIKNLFCPLATEKELAIALGIVKSLNLNPFKREVHFIKYRAEEKINIVVGYEVYIKRAERTGKLDGWETGITADGEKAWIKIYRKDWKVPFFWEVKLSEFNKKQATWNQIPTFMSQKVVIGQGFRLCFPDELGGMPYTKEETEVYDVTAEPTMKPDVEIPQAKSQEPEKKEVKPAPLQEKIPEPEKKPEEKPKVEVKSQTPPTKLSSPEQQKAIHTLATKLKMEEEIYNVLGADYGVKSTKELTFKQAHELIGRMSKELISNGKK